MSEEKEYLLQYQRIARVQFIFHYIRARWRVCSLGEARCELDVAIPLLCQGRGVLPGRESDSSLNNELAQLRNEIAKSLS